MAQPVTAIISQTEALSAKARLHTGDVNEAGLLVGKVISRALRNYDRDTNVDSIRAALGRDLDALIAQQRLAS